MERILLRPSEVAELLGIGRTKCYELIGAQVIPSIKIGSSVRVPMESLRQWVSSQTDEEARVELDRRIRSAEHRK